MATHFEILAQQILPLMLFNRDQVKVDLLIILELVLRDADLLHGLALPLKKQLKMLQLQGVLRYSILHLAVDPANLGREV